LAAIGNPAIRLHFSLLRSGVESFQAPNALYQFFEWRNGIVWKKQWARSAIRPVYSIAGILS
jgi:hypothetical protein